MCIMLHLVFHNGQAPGNSRYGRASPTNLWAGFRAIKVQVLRAWAGWNRARRGGSRIGAGAVWLADAAAAAAASQVTTGDDPDLTVRDAQQQIYTGVGGSPGNQGSPGDQSAPDDSLGTSFLPCSARASQQTRASAGNDHGPEAVTGPSTSVFLSEIPWVFDEEDLYSRCTWGRCSGDCRCGVADDISERTAPSDPADCCVVSDPFELCTWEACYDECTCRPSSRSQEPLAVTTETPAPVARYF